MTYTGFYNQVNKVVNQECMMSESVDVPRHEGTAKEIRGDIKLKNVKSTRIWGCIWDMQGYPLVGECVKMVRAITAYGQERFEVVAETITQQDGSYQLETYGDDVEDYMIIVDRKYLATEQIPKQEAYMGEIPTQEAYMGEIPTQEAYMGEIPTQEAYMGEIPTQEAYMEEVLTQEAYMEETPMQEVYMEEMPTQGVYMEEIPTQKYVECIPYYIKRTPPNQQPSTSSKKHTYISEYVTFSR